MPLSCVYPLASTRRQISTAEGELASSQVLNPMLHFALRSLGACTSRRPWHEAASSLCRCGLLVHWILGCRLCLPRVSKFRRVFELTVFGS